ncbi:unnamed protein product [Cylicostephanus goldi]|uniref:Uncharacterized protein n=1 Tax=Cylicostephanus goldi TaxID=71465 RepID=A0A3P6U4A4_CYLGO|nr:unnamed protein product [Cylicostephanus goldi]
MTSQDTRAMLSGDTVETYQEHDDDDKDSLGGEMDTMLRDYPTTLTTFETTAIAPDGTVQTISRRVETRRGNADAFFSFRISHVDTPGVELRCHCESKVLIFLGNAFRTMSVMSES